MAKKQEKKVSVSKKSAVIEEIKKFYDFMVSNKLDLLEFSDGQKVIKLARKATATSIHPIPVFSPSASASSAQATAQTQSAGGETIKSPMSGIFYRAPSPASPPYVREGDKVKQGQIICIVEAMKVFNEIKADYDCIIQKVLLDNGKPISANQDIFLIEKA